MEVIVMRLKSSFELMELDDHVIAVPVGENSNAFHGIIKLNDSAAYIFNLLKDDITEEEIVESLKKEYDAPKKTLAEDLQKCLFELKEKGLIV